MNCPVNSQAFNEKFVCEKWIARAKLECEGTTTAYGLKNVADDSTVAHTVSPLGKFAAGNYATKEKQNQQR